ncbi:hypothetical protein ACO2Q9_09775 [Variovorax sp. VNK109]|uniref:hypothetical protein n=1 Tax=Variovorax sp. VNK109 TaxID=3400919 RepID=UPI003C035CD9
MKLIISQFLRTLRERNEFDQLLPDLCLAMGYVPLSKPQTGVRQFGVDLAVVGTSPVDGAQEMLLFVIKQGDIGRREWAKDDPTAVRPSLEEVVDAYLSKMVGPEHASFRKTVVLATSGDLKQEVELNWNGFKARYISQAGFDFWGADRVAALVEQYMLDENLFAAQDRSDLRKALALSGEIDYDFADLSRLLLRQLGLKADGTLARPAENSQVLLKALRRAHLASQICVQWALTDGDSRQALWICERTLLWSWHRVQLCQKKDREILNPALAGLWGAYVATAGRYYEAVAPAFHVRDGMAGYSSEGASFSIVLFQHIGLMGSIGLGCAMRLPSNEQEADVMQREVNALADGLTALLDNHSASGSPRMDNHIIDITLALMFLMVAGRQDRASQWVQEIVKRVDIAFRSDNGFPVSTDSLEDLVELAVGSGEPRLLERLRQTSWTLATLAAWCVILKLEKHYELLRRHLKTGDYGSVTAQLWHPTLDWAVSWYVGRALDTGHSEAPYNLPATTDELRQRITRFLEIKDYQWTEQSPAVEVGLGALDFIATRHFRYPVPASSWYRFALPDATQSEESAQRTGE